MASTLAFRVSLTVTDYRQQKAGVQTLVRDAFHQVPEIPDFVEDPQRVEEAKAAAWDSAHADSLDTLATWADEFPQLAAEYYLRSAHLTVALADMKRQAYYVCKSSVTQGIIVIEPSNSGVRFELRLSELSDIPANRNLVAHVTSRHPQTV